MDLPPRSRSRQRPSLVRRDGRPNWAAVERRAVGCRVAHSDRVQGGAAAPPQGAVVLGPSRGPVTGTPCRNCCRAAAKRSCPKRARPPGRAARRIGAHCTGGSRQRVPPNDRRGPVSSKRRLLRPPIGLRHGGKRSGRLRPPLVEAGALKAPMPRPVAIAEPPATVPDSSGRVVGGKGGEVGR